MLRKNRFTYRNTRYSRYRRTKVKRIIKSQLSKLVFAAVVLAILLMLKLIDIKLTNNLIQIVRRGINYEFNLKEAGNKFKNYGVKAFNFPEKVLSVFSAEEGSMDFKPPIDGAIYKPFGKLRSSDGKTIFNNGIDIIPKKGVREVLASSQGRVTGVEDKKNLGFYVIVDYEEFKFVYGHLQDVYVKEGDSIKQGEKIGTLGNENEGHKYLHFEIWEEGEPVDPQKFININTRYN